MTDQTDAEAAADTITHEITPDGLILMKFGYVSEAFGGDRIVKLKMTHGQAQALSQGLGKAMAALRGWRARQKDGA